MKENTIMLERGILTGTCQRQAKEIFKAILVTSIARVGQKFTTTSKNNQLNSCLVRKVLLRENGRWVKHGGTQKRDEFLFLKEAV